MAIVDDITGFEFEAKHTAKPIWCDYSGVALPDTITKHHTKLNLSVILNLSRVDSRSLPTRTGTSRNDSSGGFTPVRSCDAGSSFCEPLD